MTNQIHQVTLSEETRTLSKKIYQHSLGEVWEISASHQDPKLFATRHSQVPFQNEFLGWQPLLPILLKSPFHLSIA